MVSNDSGKPVAAYVSFTSFLSFLDFLRDLPAIPRALDRSIWETKFSGSTGTRVMGTFRFLGLLDDDRPTERLERLVHADQDARKKLLKEIFRESYGEELIDGITSMSPQMMEERIEAIGTTDASKRHAVSFFVNGIKYIDLHIPANIRKRARVRRSSGKPSTAAPSTAAQRKSDAPQVEPQPVPAEEQTVPQPTTKPQFHLHGIHGTLVAMLDDLPMRVADWSKEEQDRWLEVFTTNLKYHHPAREEKRKGEPATNAESP